MNKQATPNLPARSNIQWKEGLENTPAKSGVYLTRNDRNQCWFKYYEATYGEWYMSWAELKESGDHQPARVSYAAIAKHVLAWAKAPRKPVECV